MNIVFIGYDDCVMFPYSEAINHYTSHESRCITKLNRYGNNCDVVVHGRKNVTKKIIREVDKIIGDATIIIVDRPEVTLPWLNESFDYSFSHNQEVFYFYNDIRILEDSPVYNFSRPLISNQTLICEHYGYDKVKFVPSIINGGKKEYCNHINHETNIKLSHSTKDRYNKNTNNYLKIATYGSLDRKNISYSLIENVSFQKSLEFKKKSNIGIDHIHPDFCYYGVSSLENSALGLINFVRLKDKDVRFLKTFLECDDIPWIIVDDEGDLFREILEYSSNFDLLYEDRLKTYNWFHTYWNDEIMINKFLKTMGI